MKVHLLILVLASLCLGMGNRSTIPIAATTPETKVEKAEPRGFQERLWQTVEIRPEWRGRADSAVDRYLRTKDRYTGIEQMRPDPSVPARVIFVIHGLESTWNFSRHLHEGSPLTGRTRWVPKGRPRRGSPPFTFEESAEDALYLLKDMENWDWSNMESLLQNIERYNGLGYQLYRDINSPYLWSGTRHYTRGRYVADGRYSKIAVSKQLGAATVLKAMHERGVR